MFKKIPFPVILALVAVIGLIAGTVFFSKSSVNLDDYIPKAQGGDFTLQTADGPFTLSDSGDKLAILYFGYTFCPDVCPTSLVAIGAALKMLTEAELNNIVPIFISVDPSRDTPEKLKEYASFFHPNILGMTADKAKIDDLVKRYGVYYKIQAANDSAAGYLVDHSSQIVVVQNGEIKTNILHGTPPDSIAEVLRRFL